MTEPVLVSYGGGTNSTAMLIELVRRGEAVDAVLFADTGGERPETYDYVATFSEWLVQHGYPQITVVRHLLRDGTFQSLEDECLSKAILPSIAYGFKKCSGKFKLEPQTKWTNAWPAARAAWRQRSRVVKLIGFGIDERQRADRGDAYQGESWYRRYIAGESAAAISLADIGDQRVTRDAAYSWDSMVRYATNQLRNFTRRVTEAVRYRKRYPLIEMAMGREECVRTIQGAGLRLPGKSACFFCPSSKLPEIRALSRSLQLRSLAMESKAMPGLTSIKGLGRNFAWRDVLEAENWNQLSLAFRVHTESPCECTDGDDDLEAA